MKSFYPACAIKIAANKIKDSANRKFLHAADWAKVNATRRKTLFDKEAKKIVSCCKEVDPKDSESGPQVCEKLLGLATIGAARFQLRLVSVPGEYVFNTNTKYNGAPYVETVVGKNGARDFGMGPHPL